MHTSLTLKPAAELFFHATQELSWLQGSQAGLQGQPGRSGLPPLKVRQLAFVARRRSIFPPLPSQRVFLSSRDRSAFRRSAAALGGLIPGSSHPLPPPRPSAARGSERRLAASPGHHSPPPATSSCSRRAGRGQASRHWLAWRSALAGREGGGVCWLARSPV